MPASGTTAGRGSLSNLHRTTSAATFVAATLDVEAKGAGRRHGVRSLLGQEIEGRTHRVE